MAAAVPRPSPRIEGAGVLLGLAAQAAVAQPLRLADRRDHGLPHRLPGQLDRLLLVGLALGVGFAPEQVAGLTVPGDVQIRAGHGS